MRTGIPQAGVTLLAGAAAVVPFPGTWVERTYSERAYLALERHVTPVTNLAPFAVTDALLVAAVAVLGWAAWRAFRSRSGRPRRWGRLLLRLLSAVSVLYLAFLVVWGLNYRRPPLQSRLDFAPSAVTPTAALGLARRVVADLNAFHADPPANVWPAWEDLPRTLGPSFARVQRELADVEPAAPGTPKWSLLTYYLERAGVSGFTDPFVLEVVVDRSQLPFERPFVAAHEWAHLAGYTDESEANFIGWLVCLQGPPPARYSANLALLASVLPALTPEEQTETVGGLARGPREDMRAIRRRARRIWPVLERPAWWIDDRYLRANRVEQGIRSYGSAIELVLGTRFATGWVPVRK